MKLLIQNSPYILTFLGFIIYFNKICNILFKKDYKHPKEYFLKIDEKITSDIIFPVMFIAEEVKEKQLIWRYFKELISQKLHCKSPNKYQIVSYFIDKSTGRLDRNKFIETVQETVSQMPSQDQKCLQLYLFGDNECSKNLILQLLISPLIEWQLNLNQESFTKKIFNQIKERCYEFVECSASMTFVINKAVLLQILSHEISPSKEQNLSDSLTEDNFNQKLLMNDSNKLNINLLENALLDLVFSHQTIKRYDFDIKITLFRKKSNNFITQFLKADLWEIGFQDKGKIDYGFDYKIKNNTLQFYGTPTKAFSGKTIVVQISDHRHRILKELWIHGTQNQVDFMKIHPNNSQGNNYEIL